MCTILKHKKLVHYEKIVSILTLVVFSVSCSVIRPIVDYDNDLGYLYLKPVGIPPEKISDTKIYVLEGSLASGDWVLFVVKAPILKKILDIKWPENNQGQFLNGFAFTINNLGKKSYLSEKEIESGMYDASQKEFLLRNKNRRKYEIVSDLPYPALGQMQEGKIVLVTKTNLPPGFRSAQ